MNIVIRKPILELSQVLGIPEDFNDILEYFNRGISTKARHYKLMPRQTPITKEEIKKLWMQSPPENMSFVAVDLDNTDNKRSKVVGAITISYNHKSTNYEHASLRQGGVISLTVSPDYKYADVAEPMLVRAVKELEEKGLKATVTTSIESEEGLALIDKMFKDKPRKKLSGYIPYKAIGLSGEAIEWTVP